MPDVARNLVIRNSDAKSGGRAPLDKKYASPERRLSSGWILVRSHHNPRLFITKGTDSSSKRAAAQYQNSLPSDTSGCEASHGLHRLPYPKMP